MDNLPQGSILLALSQLLQEALIRGRREIALKRTMPFLTLQRAARKLGQGSYSQANRLIDLEWAEAHVTHVSKETHHHAYITNHSRSVSAQKTVKGQNHKSDANSAAVGASSDDGAAAADSSNGAVEHSIINRSLSYRPLFIQNRQLTGESPLRDHSAQARYRQMPEMVGLLNGKRHRLHRQAGGQPSETAGPVSGAAVSWSIALSAAHGAHQQSGSGDLARQSSNSTLPPDRLPEVRPVDSSFAESSSNRPSGAPGDIAFAQASGQDSKSGLATMPYVEIQAQLLDRQFDAAMNYSNSFSEMPAGMPTSPPRRNFQAQLPADQFDFTMDFTTLPAQLTPGLPSSLPHRKPRGHPLSEDLDSGAKFSKSVAQKIEALVAEKVDTMTRADNRNKLSIDEVRQEFKTKLKPESLVSEEMIKIFLRKLQKTKREERFRMGLMS